jgi:hypothetical protein
MLPTLTTGTLKVMILLLVGVHLLAPALRLEDRIVALIEGGIERCGPCRVS